MTLTAINWGSAAGQSGVILATYLANNNISGSANIVNIVNTLTAIYKNVQQDGPNNVGDPWSSTPVSGSASLEAMMNGVIPFIIQAARGIWNWSAFSYLTSITWTGGAPYGVGTGGTQTTNIGYAEHYIYSWMVTNMTNCPAQLMAAYNGGIPLILGNYINTVAMPIQIVAPVDFNGATYVLAYPDDFNKYITGVAGMLRNIAKYLRDFAIATKEDNSNSSSNGSYVAALPDNVY